MTPYEAAQISYQENDAPPNSADTQYVLREGFLAFRGTTNLRDLVTDISVEATRFHGCWVHAGVVAAYLAVANDVRNAVAEQPEVHLAGHSLGGGLAVIAALDLHRLFPALQLRVTTYGAPRVGDVHLARLLADVPQTRWVYGNDIITTVPHILLPGTIAFHSSGPVKLGGWMSRWLPPWPSFWCHELENYSVSEAAS